MNNDPKAPVTAWVDGLNKADAAAVARCFRADGVLVDVGTGGRAEGRDAVREHLTGLFAMFSDLRIELTNFLSSEGHFADEWTMAGVCTVATPPACPLPERASASSAPRSARWVVPRS